MRINKLFIVAFFFSSFMSHSADTSNREEQVSYSILAFNGRDYSYSFSLEQTETLYFIEEQDNFLSLSKSLFYYWPITDEWKTDTETLNYIYNGFVEVTQGNKIIKQINLSEYVIFAKDEEYEVRWYIEKGDVAKDIYYSYKEKMNNYWDNTSVYNKQITEINSYQTSLISKIETLKDLGQDVSSLIIQLAEINYPDQPIPPSDYISPPHSINNGYLLNLPYGEYNIRFRTPKGYIVEGSEKKIIVYKKNTARTVGYEIMPENKWTRSVVSERPQSVIYLDGSTDLYLQCYYQDQYNNFFHSKTVDPTVKGDQITMKWFRVMQIENAGIISTYEDGISNEIASESYTVDQKEGNSLGYSIIPFNSEMEQSGEVPSLVAFHFPINKNNKKILFYAIDGKKEIIPNSIRQIRVLSNYKGYIISLFLILLPLIISLPPRVMNTLFCSASLIIMASEYVPL